jgi:hypothetical protein
MRGDEMTDKKPRVYPKIDEKHAAFAILVGNGVDKVVAAEALGYKGKTAYALQKRIEKKVGLDVTNERLVRLSHRVIRNCLQGKPWGKIEVIKDSTALAAAVIVVDRHQPKNQEISPPPRSYTVVNLDECKPGHPSYCGNLALPGHGSLVEPAGGDPVPIPLGDLSGKDEEPA